MTKVADTTGPSSRRRRPGRPAWGRHASAVAATLAANAALVLFLSSWHLPPSRADRSPTRAVPIEVTDLPSEQMQIARDQPAASPAPPQPPQPPLPAPPVLELPAAALSLDAPSAPGMDAIRIPDLAAELPAFVAEPVAAPAVVRQTPRPVAPKPTTTRRAAPSRGPVLIQPPDLADYYPRRARMRGVTGRTTVRLTISIRGRVIDVSVVSSTPAGVFEVAAKRAARMLSFRPAVRDGRPVRSAVSLNMIWRLQE